MSLTISDQRILPLLQAAKRLRVDLLGYQEIMAQDEAVAHTPFKYSKAEQVRRAMVCAGQTVEILEKALTPEGRRESVRA